MHDEFVFRDSNNLKTVKDKVKLLLEERHDVRNDDKLMVLTFYSEFYQLHDHCKNFSELKDWLSRSKVPTFGTIIRIRTWLQTNYPHLRGSNWEKRANLAHRMVDNLADIAEEEGVGPVYGDPDEFL